MINVGFGLFTIIFFVIFAFALFTIFRAFGRVSQLQNRVFDAVEDQLAQRQQTPPEDRSPDGPRDYHCDQCGAALGEEADVSPSGDFKCTYCGKWSNIHT